MYIKDVEKQATPRPWELRQHSDSEWAITHGGIVIAVCKPRPEVGVSAQANAALIAHKCKHWDKLLEALINMNWDHPSVSALRVIAKAEEVEGM